MYIVRTAVLFGLVVGLSSQITEGADPAKGSKSGASNSTSTVSAVGGVSTGSHHHDRKVHDIHVDRTAHHHAHHHHHAKTPPPTGTTTGGTGTTTGGTGTTTGGTGTTGKSGE